MVNANRELLILPPPNYYYFTTQIVGNPHGPHCSIEVLTF